MTQTPRELLNIINNTTNRLVSLGAKIKRKRLDVILYQSKLCDVENEARNDLFTGKEEIQASRIRDYIKWRTGKEYKENEIAKLELRQLIDEREMLIEIINTAKSSLRILEMEIKGLNYLPST